MVVLGKIVEPYGLQGAVKVFPFADDPAAWGALSQWWVGAESAEPSSWRLMRVRRCRVRGDILVAELDGVSDRNASEALQGLLVGVPKADLPAAAEGEYYWADLVGLTVINVRGETLGTVSGLIETTANHVLRVGGADDRERLLPFVGAVIRDVDVAAGLIRVEWELDW